MAEGICKLTGETGEFVNSHLYPVALTRPEIAGAPLVQAGQGNRSIRRWSSWSDRALVIQKGEDILARLDDWAIKELRRLKLIWSGWGPMLALGQLHTTFAGTSMGVREVEVSNPRLLRLFFLSILWRAAATTRHEFSEVELPKADLERLRQMIVHDDPGPISFYPAQLTQLSTLGFAHNFAPLASVKSIPAIGDHAEKQIPILRFYFEGLITHVHRHATDDGYAEAMDRLMVGAQTKLLVTTVTSEESFEHKNLAIVMRDTDRLWPQVLAKLEGLGETNQINVSAIKKA